MPIEIDARGLSCPLPVMKAKEAIEKGTDDEIIVLVNSPTAKENVTRFAEWSGRLVESSAEGVNFRLNLKKGDTK